MNELLTLVVRFSAAAIEEALARRAAPAEYRADDEIARLVSGLSSPARPGLDTRGKAHNARACLLTAMAEAPEASLSRTCACLPDAISRDLFLLLLAWLVDPRIGQLFGHLHDALQRTRPSFGACAEVLAAPVEVAKALEPSAFLRRFGWLELDHFGPDGSLTLDPRPFLFAATGTLPPLDVTPGKLTLVMPERAARPSGGTPANTEVLVLRGLAGSGRTRALLSRCSDEGRPALLLTLRAGSEARSLVATALRDARVLGARLLVSGALHEEESAELAHAEDVPLGLRLEPAAPIPAPLLARPIRTLTLEVPNPRERAVLWAEVLGRSAADQEVVAVADRYAFSPGTIRRAAVQAPSVGLERAARMQLESALEGFSFPRSSTRIGWERLVLPEPAVDSLRAMCAQARHAAEVGEDWGFSRHHALGHGVKALFHGKPGTGKTLAAELLASELELPIVRVDLSRVVSKWIGETEQNLSKIFDAAAQSRAILFFDEADALFARRTAVNTSTDRYANMEVNYLLQRVEAHDGIVVLATNLKANLDDAFARRLHYSIEFPEPDAEARERIWRLSVPPEAPLSSDVDLAHLARRFEIPGGAIKSTVLGAAYLAAAERSAISQRHFALALRREYAKLDRLYQKGDLDRMAKTA